MDHVQHLIKQWTASSASASSASASASASAISPVIGDNWVALQIFGVPSEVGFTNTEVSTLGPLPKSIHHLIISNTQLVDLDLSGIRCEILTIKNNPVLESIRMPMYVKTIIIESPNLHTIYGFEDAIHVNITCPKLVKLPLLPPSLRSFIMNSTGVEVIPRARESYNLPNMNFFSVSNCPSLKVPAPERTVRDHMFPEYDSDKVRLGDPYEPAYRNLWNTYHAMNDGLA